MTDLSDMPVPAFTEAFRLRAAPGEPVDVGRLATGGTRRHRPYPAGTLEGRGLAGKLVSGGETLLDRPDGVTVLEAAYLVRLDDGAMLRLIGTGYETETPYAGARMTIVIEADEDGPHAALTTRAFAGERPAGDDLLTLFEIV